MADDEDSPQDKVIPKLPVVNKAMQDKRMAVWQKTLSQLDAIKARQICRQKIKSISPSIVTRLNRYS